MDKKGLSDSGSACEELRNGHSILISPKLNRLKNQELPPILEKQANTGSHGFTASLSPLNAPSSNEAQNIHTCSSLFPQGVTDPSPFRS